MRLRSASRRPGLSLLEVLGSTAIFLISLVAIYELMNMATDEAQEVQFRSRGTRLCQSKLNEFAAGIEQLSGSTEGAFDEEPAWTWSANVTTETMAVNLFRVEMTVRREGPRGPVEVTMTQFMFDPQQRGQLYQSESSSSGSSDTTQQSGASGGTPTGGASGGTTTPTGGGGGGGTRPTTGGTGAGSGGGGGRPTGGGGSR